MQDFTSLTPDDFTSQGESAVTRWVKERQKYLNDSL